jgi:hypothetical protein
MRQKPVIAAIVVALIWGVVEILASLAVDQQYLPVFLSLHDVAMKTGLAWAAIWLARGLALAVALRLTGIMSQWTQIGILAGVWMLCGMLQWYLRWPVAGLLTLLITHGYALSVRWKDAGIILAAFIIAPFITAWSVTTLLAVIPIIGLTFLQGMLLGFLVAGILYWRLASKQALTSSDREADNSSLRAMLQINRKNPVMQRLLGLNIERQIYMLVAAAFGLGIMGLLSSMFMWNRVRVSLSGQGAMIPLLVYLVTLAPTVRMPFVVAATSALLTATDAQTQQFELLRLTPVTGRKIAWIYTLAPLRHTRGLLTFEYIVMLLMLSAAMCAFLPSFPSTENQIILSMFLSLIMVSLALLGTNLLASAVGMRIAFRLRKPGLAAVIAPMIMLMLILPGLAVIVDSLSSLSSDFSVEVLVGLSLFTMAPYIAAVKLVDTTKPWGQPALRDYMFA